MKCIQDPSYEVTTNGIKPKKTIHFYFKARKVV